MIEFLSTNVLLISSSDIDTDLHVAEDQMTLSPHPSSGVFHEPFRSLKNAGPWKKAIEEFLAGEAHERSAPILARPLRGVP